MNLDKNLNRLLLTEQLNIRYYTKVIPKLVWNIPVRKEKLSVR